jgi:rare lipoprotein A
LFVLAAALLVVCAACRKKPQAGRTPGIGATQTGIASWYGNPYHGRHAANGEVYDMEKLTAAHRTLPFGTWVQVRSLTNGKSVEVRINDRGPFVDERVIDLSRAAARRIDMLGPGTAKVRLKIIARPPNQEADLYAVQAGAFEDRKTAERVRGELQQRYGSARLVRRDARVPLWRVLVGKEDDYSRAQGLAERIRRGHGPAFVVRLDETGR